MSPALLAVIPAAGVGSRMGGDGPKQYLPLGGHTVLWYALSALLAVPRVQRVVLVLAPDDVGFDAHTWPCDPRWQAVRLGGASRAESVLAGLEHLARAHDAQDWVLVHDAARPLLAPADVTRLIDQTRNHPCGGLLACPVAETVKRGDADHHINATVDRTDLWLAQTPQLFRLGPLRAALSQHPHVTDECAAMESAGHRPLLVASSRSNFKITWPDDLVLAQSVLDGAPQSHPTR